MSVTVLSLLLLVVCPLSHAYSKPQLFEMIVTLTQTVSKQNKKLDQVTAMVSSLKLKYDSLTETTETLTETSDTCTERTDSMIANFDSFTDRMETFGESLAELIGNVNRLTGRTNALASNVGGLTDDVGKLTERVDNRDRDVSALIGNVNKLTGDVRALTTTTNTLNGKTDALTRDIDDVNERANAQADFTSALSGEVSTLAQNVDSLTDDVDTVADNVDAVANNVASLNSDVSALTGRVDVATDRIVTLTDNVNTLTGNVATLTGEVDTLVIKNSRMDSIVQTFNRLQAAVERSEKRTELAGKSIGFHAAIKSTTYSSQAFMTADEVILNDDEAFDATTGTFTAPINGTYIFVANLVPSASSPRKNRLIAYLLVDDSAVNACFSGFEGSYFQGSCQVVTRLAGGQQVRLKNIFSNSAYDASFFTGALLHADLPQAFDM